MTWPSDAELFTAWDRMSGDPTAGGAFVALVLRPLVRQLAAWRPTADQDAIESVATDVLLWLVKQPAKYNPDKSPLRVFLLMVARRKLLTALESERRHQSGKIRWDDVEFALASRNEEENDTLPSFDHPALKDVVDSLNDVDRQLFELMRDDVREYARFAAVMGITGLPLEDQERQVKRAKDRIKARLKRAVGECNG
ncbi:MAG: sigma-70 family RNA polymerase sigma factor [Fimbriiglobus sp.]|nr:sigma-70 family RNA polymerase sigma factor [Fimbriiglobus sp.]